MGYSLHSTVLLLTIFFIDMIWSKQTKWEEECNIKRGKGNKFLIDGKTSKIKLNRLESKTVEQKWRGQFGH